MIAPTPDHRGRAQTWAFTIAFTALIVGTLAGAWIAREAAIDDASPGVEPDYTVAWAMGIGGAVAVLGLLAVLLVTWRHQRRLRRVNQELAEAAVRTRALQEVTGRLARALSGEDVVSALLDHLPTVVGAKSAAVATISEAGPIEVLHREPTHEATHIEPAVGSVIAGVLDDLEPAWLPSPLGWRGDESADTLAAGGWAMAVLPLEADDVRGLLAVSYPRVHTFVDEERALLETIGVLAARAFARGRRYDAEHRASVAFQRTALPTSLPTVDGLTVAARYRAGSHAATVGGDWYDVVDLGEDRVALLVGDVVGHGMEAAVAMGRLRTGFRMIAALQREPGAMVQAVSQQVDAIPNALCSTVICAVLHVPTGIVEWCRAGHLPPVLVHEEKAELLEGIGVPPLGVAPEIAPPVHHEVLVPGDVLLLYTDGLIERRHESIDDGFGRLRLVSEDLADLNPEDLSDALLEALVPVEEQTDDVALLVVRLDAPAPPAAG